MLYLCEDGPAVYLAKSFDYIVSVNTPSAIAGQDSATEEATGQMYKLTWAQDADGTLSIDKWDAIHRNEANLNSAATL
jgi:hypothetical protein